MDIDGLAERLRDPDPHVRVETLRILAMVEETNALEAIRWLYRNDPEPGVRDVAGWAGKLIWQAHRRGHSTQQAVEALFVRPLSPDSQERFLASLGQFDLRYAKHRDTQTYALHQTYRRQLNDALHEADGVPLETDKVQSEALARPAQVAAQEYRQAPRPAAKPRRDENLDAQEDLLDAGLSDDFWGRTL